MKVKFFGFIFCFLIANFLSLGQNNIDQFPVLKGINPMAIKGHMTFLSQDLLKGRRPGSDGFEIASTYVESQFINLGLLPTFGDSFRQNFPLIKATVNFENSQISLINGEKINELEIGKQFLLSTYYGAKYSEISAPIVFIGYGISAHEFSYNDYANIDVKGKIVVYINGAPDNFPNSERAYYSGANVKNQLAIENGAIGVISFNHPSDTRRTWSSSVNRARNGEFKWQSEEGITMNGFPELKAVAMYNNEYLKDLFVNAPGKLELILSLFEKGKSASFPLNISAKMQVETEKEILPSHNIIGEIKGSDPKLKDEYLVYAAHLDHLGIGSTVNGDSIYNGAHDNAAGVSILLEIAKTYQALEVKPKRSVLFAIVTGEESGLLGSDYLANNPPIGKEKMVANISMDMPFFFHPVLDIVPYGAIHSSLGNQTKEAADILGLELSPDPFPEQVVFIRSDHYSFIKKGIPALFIKSGFKTIASDTIDRAFSDVNWRKTHYHTPQDDMNQPFDFNAAATHVKVNFLIGYLVTNDTAIPSWNKGDFFGDKMTKK
jgi:hypothetical protein